MMLPTIRSGWGGGLSREVDGGVSCWFRCPLTFWFQIVGGDPQHVMPDAEACRTEAAGPSDCDAPAASALVMP